MIPNTLDEINISKTQEKLMVFPYQLQDFHGKVVQQQHNLCPVEAFDYHFNH